MGADAFALLRRWHRAAEIPFVAPLIVASRPSESLSQLDDLKALLPDGLTLAGQGFDPDKALKATPSDGLTLVGQGFSPDMIQAQDTGALAPEACSPSASQIDLRRYILRNPSGQQSPFYLLPGLDIDISASEIRDLIRAQTLHPAQLPAAVFEYIRAHRLYS
jgi:nicotinate-nucleotide adenylyltransferase